MPTSNILILIPTYNEQENIEAIYQEIRAQGLSADLLFIDDNIQLSRTKELFRSEYMHQNSPVQLYSLFSLIILSFFNIFLRVLSHSHNI